jgi:O-antigen/teichoic acid export membrane protein
MNLGKSIREGVKWLLVGNTGRQILQFAFGIALARLLVPADFGMIATIQVFTGFVAMFATGGMGQSLIRAKEASTEDFSVVFTLQLALGVLIYALFFLSAPWIAHYFENPLYADLLRVSALIFILRPFTLIRISWLTREMEFKKNALVDLTASMLTGVSSVAMALVGMGVWSLALSGLLGALVGSILFLYVTPLRPRLHFRIETIRKHSGFGIKIVAVEFLEYMRDASINLILSKMGGPALLGLFNKAESLSRMPNRLITPPTGQTVFRAMSKVQSDLDQTKYMFYRTISLLMVYIIPFLVGLWWVAEPLIEVIYGPKWLPAAGPLEILVFAAVFRTVRAPCGVVLAAQNRLTQEMVAQSAGFLFAIAACLIGIKWGLEGVAWAFLASVVFSTTYLYILVYRTLRTRVADLLRAAAPAVILNIPLCAVLAVTHFLTVDLRSTMPVLYLGIMVASGSLVYASAFLFLPIPALRAEVARWRQQIKSGLQLVSRALA